MVKGYPVVGKNTYDAFIDTNFGAMLKEKEIERVEAEKGEQYGILANYDKVNGNLVAMNSNLSDRLKIAEGKMKVTVVEHVRVLEEAQRFVLPRRDQ